MNENDNVDDVAVADDFEIGNNNDNSDELNVNEDDDVGGEDDPLWWASLHGLIAALERRLLIQEQEAGDSYSFHGGKCLIAAVCSFQPECTRLLIEHGADVTYALPGNSSILYHLIRCFLLSPNADTWEEGACILAADLLIDAGAPTNDRGAQGLTALDILQHMRVTPETQISRERDGLLSLLRGQYWSEWNNKNPFLHASSHPDEMVWLLMKGAANGPSNPADSVNHTRIRSIPPKQRHSVLKALARHEASFRAFMNILFTVQDETNNSKGHPLRVFHGMQDTVMAEIAAFAGVLGKSLLNARAAATVLEELPLLGLMGEMSDSDEDDDSEDGEVEEMDSDHDEEEEDNEGDGRPLKRQRREETTDYSGDDDDDGQ